MIRRGAPSRALHAAVAGLLACVLAAPREAEAQPNAQQVAVAEALVEQGKALLEQGKLDEACRTFEEADRASGSWATGALAKLAECHEKAGRLATAWGTWIKVELAASRAGQRERADYARSRVADLDGRAPKLTIVVPAALREQAGLEVMRDAAVLAPAEWSLTVRVDPGRHAVRVRAPLHLAWEAAVDLRVGEVQLVLPSHLDESPAPSAAPIVLSPRGEDAVGRTQRRAGIGVGVVGLAALEAGGALGITALVKGRDASFVCGSKLCASQAPGAMLANDARGFQSAAAVSAVFGVAALASGLVIYFAAPTARGVLSGSAPALAAVVEPRAAALRLRW